MYTCMFNYAHMQDIYVYMQDNYVYMCTLVLKNTVFVFVF